MKELRWVGRALDDLRSFPKGAKEDLGYQLHQVQHGETPIGSKSMSDVGRGVRELCVASDASWYRAFYVASIGDYVWVLHCFQKKTNTTSQSDVAIGKTRYRAIDQ